MGSLRVAAVTALLGLTFVAAAQGGQWRVGRDVSDCPGGCNFHDGNSNGPGFGIDQAMVSLEVLPGDTVLVYPGEYVAKVGMKSGVALLSAAGPEVTTIVGSAGAEAALFLVGTDPATEIGGFTVTWDSSTEGLGGGVAAYVSSGRIHGNIFRSNRAGIGAGVYFQSCDIVLEDNLFVSNNSQAGGGAVALSGGTPTIRSNTFVSNFAPFGFEGAVLYGTGSSFVFDRNLVADSQGASAIFCGSGNVPTVTCNLFFANQLGSFAGQCVDSVGTSGNIQGDPLFCNAAAGDYGLCADSPALTTPCGTIGITWAAGCPSCGATTALAETSWGRLKALYR